MPNREPVEVTNLDIYGHDPLPWSRARDALTATSPTPDVTFFLGTARPDGRPHAAGIGAGLPGEQFHRQIAVDTDFPAGAMGQPAPDGPAHRVPVQEIERKQCAQNDAQDGCARPLEETAPGETKIAEIGHNPFPYILFRPGPVFARILADRHGKSIA